jgi:nucleoside diphosphate kinase
MTTASPIHSTFMKKESQTTAPSAKKFWWNALGITSALLDITAMVSHVKGPDFRNTIDPVHPDWVIGGLGIVSLASFYMGKSEPYEQTLVILKPDALEETATTGEILWQIENTGLEITHKKQLRMDRRLAEQHIDYDGKYCKRVGKKTRNLFTKKNIDPTGTCFNSPDSFTLGKVYKEKTIDYLTVGDCIVMVVSGPNAIKKMKKLCGSTFPEDARPNSIRYSLDSNDTLKQSTAESRVVRDLIDTSTNEKEATAQIKLWLPRLCA